MHNYPFCTTGYLIETESKKLNWYPSDTKDLFEKNLKENYELLKKYGWLEQKIIYEINQYGFRSEKFENSIDSLFFGCSFTFGIGLKNEDVWVNLLKNKINVNGYNLSVPGGSMDSVFRLANYWIPKLKPKFIFLLSPSSTRREYFLQNKFTRSMVPNTKPIDNYEKLLLEIYNNDIISEHSSNINFDKNLMAIKHLCKTYNCKLFEMQTDNLNYNFKKSARDLIHYGKDFQIYLFKLFQRKFYE